MLVLNTHVCECSARARLYHDAHDLFRRSMFDIQQLFASVNIMFGKGFVKRLNLHRTFVMPFGSNPKGPLTMLLFICSKSVRDMAAYV